MYFSALKKRQMVSALAICLAMVLYCICIGCSGSRTPNGDPDNGGLILPEGFEALVVADSVGNARHLAVNDNGDIYVKLTSGERGKGNVAIRDLDKDGKADSLAFFGDYEEKSGYGPTSMRIFNGYLYYGTKGAVYRSKLSPDSLLPTGEIELVLSDNYLIEHIAKSLAFDDQGHMYVGFGSISNACQLENRTPGSPGQQPCAELAAHAGIWRFDTGRINMTQKDGVRYATGLRSVIAMTWNHHDSALYVLQHGRDDLKRTWPDLFTDYQNALLPSEEFFKVTEGFDGGWPYYYYDQVAQKKMLSPEYGGDGEKTGGGDSLIQPLIGFPGHWAPNDLLFYTGDQFPERYKNGAFIAFHGSANRTLYPQSGYIVCFVPFENGVPSGHWEVFADGFAGKDTIINSADVDHRPMGLAMGPDGSLFVSDDAKGRIWRVMFKGDKKLFGEVQLSVMEKRKERLSIKTPEEGKDNFQMLTAGEGAKIYNTYCISCHQADGKGDGNRFPPVEKSEWVTGDKNRLIETLLKGLSGPITVAGRGYDGVMPGHAFLSDGDLSIVLTYIRGNFSNNADAVQEADVAAVRNKLKSSIK